MLIAIRVDSSDSIGFGHLARTLNIALELRSRSHKVYFICRDLNANGCAWIESAGFEIIGLPRPKKIFAPKNPRPKHLAWLGVSLREEIADSQRALEGVKIVDWLAIDSYALDRRYERAMRPYCRKIAVLDDLADRPHDCDLIIDGAFGRDIEDYKTLVGKKSEKLFGVDYMPLRRDFASFRSLAMPRRFPPRGILVAMGGIDAKNLTGEALKAIANSAFRSASIVVVLSSFAPFIAQNQKLGSDLNLAIDWQIDAPNMPFLIASADLGVGAAGVGAYERACLGLASVTTLAAANQRENLTRLGSIGAVIKTESIGEALERLDERSVRACERSAFATCDALGVLRICDALERLR
ncbi:MAG: UDP-2,4-diacetamido-2,4,6-trideoxy-beta-L-altropyranose hydrolase [Helicobacteraceae bacterium]|nr:UDP-2,4-diacetamido-2,4,6-trideoxy-beta-L-altropyranose hydrolase [Helicobacteraceae bacterium]